MDTLEVILKEPIKLELGLGLKGSQGVKGDKGDAGPQGPQGIQGPQGVQGLSAYQVAVNNGYTGSESEWVASLESGGKVPNAYSSLFLKGVIPTSEKVDDVLSSIISDIYGDRHAEHYTQLSLVREPSVGDTTIALAGNPHYRVKSNEGYGFQDIDEEGNLAFAINPPYNKRGLEFTYCYPDGTKIGLGVKIENKQFGELVDENGLFALYKDGDNYVAIRKSGYAELKSLPGLDGITGATLIVKNGNTSSEMMFDKDDVRVIGQHFASVDLSAIHVYINGDIDKTNGFNEFNLKYTNSVLNGVVKEIVIKPDIKYVYDYSTGILSPSIELTKTGDNEFTLTISGRNTEFPNLDKFSILNGVTGATLNVNGVFTDIQDDVVNTIFNHISNLIINDRQNLSPVRIKQGETRVINVKGKKSDGSYATSRLYDNRSERGTGSFDYSNGAFTFDVL